MGGEGNSKQKKSSRSSKVFKNDFSPFIKPRPASRAESPGRRAPGRSGSAAGSPPRLGGQGRALQVSLGFRTRCPGRRLAAPPPLRAARGPCARGRPWAAALTLGNEAPPTQPGFQFRRGGKHHYANHLPRPSPPPAPRQPDSSVLPSGVSRCPKVPGRGRPRRPARYLRSCLTLRCPGAILNRDSPLEGPLGL